MAVLPPSQGPKNPKKLATGLETFESVVIAPYLKGGHPRYVDLVQPRRNYQKRRPGEKQDHVFVYQDKDSGIEPGFLAFDADDAFYKQMNIILIKKLKDARLAIIHKLPPNENTLAFQLALTALTKQDKDPIKSIDAYISSLERSLERGNPQSNFVFNKFFGFGLYPDCEKLLMQGYMNWRKQLPSEKQPNMKFLKGDFSDAAGKVSVGAERTLVTSSMKKAKKLLGKTITQNVIGFFYNLAKRDTKKNKSIAFVQETLTNNLAVSYGIPGQTASIKPGAYKDGTPMLVMEQTWAKGFQSFEGRLKGGSKKSGSTFAKDLDPNLQAHITKYKNNKIYQDKYPELMKIQFQSDDTIKGIPESLAFLLVAGDYDVLGSGGANKGTMNNMLYGIDFGHSFDMSRSNTILAFKGKPNLRDDFRFKQADKTIKHMDAFYDHPLSDMMQGVYFLMKQNGVAIPKNVLEWYEDKAQYPETPEGQAAKAFLDKLNKIESKSAQALFDQYIKKFEEAAEYNKAYKGYADEFRKMKNKYIADRNAFLAVFNKRIFLNPDQLTLIENMEKLLCDPKHVKNVSPDGTVLLNHLRVDFDHRVACQLGTALGGMKLVIEHQDKPFFLKFKEKMALFAKQFSPGLHEKLSIRYDDAKKMITVICPDQHKAEFMQAFQENNIAQFINKPTGSLLQSELTAVQAVEQEVKAGLEKHQKMASPIPREVPKAKASKKPLVLAYGHSLKSLASLRNMVNSSHKKAGVKAAADAAVEEGPPKPRGPKPSPL